MLKGKVACILVFMVLFLLISPTGCTCEPNEAVAAKVEMTIDPNPIPCEDGYWSWKVILTETNGVGVKLTGFTKQFRKYYRRAVIKFDSSEIEKEYGSSYIPPYGSLCCDRWYPCEGGITYVNLTFTGIDDNGHKVVVKGRQNFLSP